jgi:uncharacterized membrane protein
LWSIIIIVLVGMPFYVVSQLWKKITDARVKDAQKRYWLNRRK